MRQHASRPDLTVSFKFNLNGSCFVQIASRCPSRYERSRINCNTIGKHSYGVAWCLYSATLNNIDQCKIDLDGATDYF